MKVGYIGLGNMGKPMASHLAPAGFETTVFDIAAEPVAELVETGAIAASSVAEVAKASDVLCLCVPADTHVVEVLRGTNGSGGALDELAPGSVVAIHSTVKPETIEAMHEVAAARGSVVVDAAVTGGEAGALAGELVFLVGGEESALEKIRPVLDASSQLVIHAGARGAGARLKLAVNLLGYVHFAACREAFAVAHAAGVDPAQVIEATRATGQLSDAEMRFVPLAQLPNDIELPDELRVVMRNHVANADKDLGHALDLAREAGLPLPTAEVVRRQMPWIFRSEGGGGK